MSNYYDDATLVGWSLDGADVNAMSADILSGVDAFNFVDSLTASSTQVNYLSTSTGDIQTQINTLASSITASSSFTIPVPDYLVYYSGSTIYGVKASDNSVVASGSTATVIQAVVDAAETAGDKWIHLKAGSYELSASLNINSHIHLSGDGPEATEIKAANSLNADMVVLNSDLASLPQYRPIIDGIKFDGNNGNVTAGSCLVLYGCVEGRIQNCHFENMYDYGIEFLGQEGETSGSFGHNNVVFNCLFDQGYTSSGAGAGIYFRRNDENHVQNCKFQYLTRGIYDKQGLARITNNDFVNYGNGVYVEDASRSIIQGNYFDRLTGHGVYLKGPFNIVTGNVFFSISDGNTGVSSGVAVEWYGMNTVTNNQFMAHDTGDSRSAIREYNPGDDTAGYNNFSNNFFIAANGPTSIGGTGWATASIETASTTNITTDNVDV